MQTVHARGPSNIALVKYWGKRDLGLNLPATGSISVTLDGLETVAAVSFPDGSARDEIRIDGREDPRGAARVVRFLDLVRETYGRRAYARIDSRNNFPTGAGLASSASAFAALTVALDRALGLGLGPAERSVLARRGSGSAARSLVDGFAEMAVGVREDGTDAYAEPLGGPDLLPMDILVAVTTTAAKKVASTEGMIRTQETSPFHAAWLERTGADLDAMREALLRGDLERVGTLAEGNALRMHASMLATDPPLLYWNPATVAVIHEVHRMRDEGEGAWVTIDAGPQVKVLCEAGRGERLAPRLEALPGVEQVLRSRPGLGASVIDA